MSPYARDIRDGRAAVERVLDELGLRGFVFTIEAKGPGWQLRVECPTSEGWQTIDLPVDLAELREGLAEVAVRERLREAWREHFRACLRSTPPR